MAAHVRPHIDDNVATLEKAAIVLLEHIFEVESMPRLLKLTDSGNTFEKICIPYHSFFP